MKVIITRTNRYLVIILTTLSVHSNAFSNSLCTLQGTITTNTVNESFLITQINKASSMKDVINCVSQKQKAYPISNAFIELTGPNLRKSAKSDSNGNYVFTEIPKGKYTLQSVFIITQGGVSTEYFAKQSVNIGEQKTAICNLRLDSDLATIEGKVVDTNGIPVSGVKIKGKYYSKNPAYASNMNVPVISAISKEDGTYELKGINKSGFFPVAALLSKQGSPDTIIELSIAENKDQTQNFARIPLVTQRTVNVALQYIQVCNQLNKSLCLETQITKQIDPRLVINKWETNNNKSEYIYLPTSTNNVIYLPDIILDNEKPKSQSQKEDEQSVTEQ